MHLPLRSDYGVTLTYGTAVGVPGELRGWELLHQKHGKLPWAKLFEGAINLARHGFTVNQDLAAALNNGVGSLVLCSLAEPTDKPSGP